MCMIPPGDCCADTPVIDGKINMCTQTGQDINISTFACKGILNAGGSCGPCPEPEEEPVTEPIEESVPVTESEEYTEK